MPDDLEGERLTCAECQTESGAQAAGWRALLVSDDDEQPLRDDAALMFCPARAAREFDGD